MQGKGLWRMELEGVQLRDMNTFSNEREKIRRNVRALGMKHKYEEPDWLK